MSPVGVASLFMRQNWIKRFSPEVAVAQLVYLTTSSFRGSWMKAGWCKGVWSAPEASSLNRWTWKRDRASVIQLFAPGTWRALTRKFHDPRSFGMTRVNDSNNTLVITPESKTFAGKVGVPQCAGKKSMEEISPVPLSEKYHILISLFNRVWCNRFFTPRVRFNLLCAEGRVYPNLVPRTFTRLKIQLELKIFTYRPGLPIKSISQSTGYSWNL